MSDRYSDEMDTLDASVFSGELLHTNFEEFKKYVARWQRAIDEHVPFVDEEDGEEEE